MTPLALAGLGPSELIIILVVVLLLFGGSRLAGLGKSSGRALREFKEETKGLMDKDKGDAGQGGATDAPVQQPVVQQPVAQQPVVQQPVAPEPLAPTDPTYQQPPRSESDVRRDA